MNDESNTVVAINLTTNEVLIPEVPFQYPAGLDFDSDEPLPMPEKGPCTDEVCESCQ